MIVEEYLECILCYYYSVDKTEVYALSRDHKPSDLEEQKRILESDGKIYKYYQVIFRSTIQSSNREGEIVIGPTLVLPGKLPVSRIFGNTEAKLSLYGGKEGIILAVPEIKSFRITDDFDFIVLGSNGVFETISNKDILHCVIRTLQESKETKNFHKICAESVKCIVKNALMRKATKNTTVVMIALSPFKYYGQKKGKVEVSRNFNKAKARSSSIMNYKVFTKLKRVNSWQWSINEESGSSKFD